MARPLLLITGIAEGLGAEIAKTFARAGGTSSSARMSPQAIAKACLDLMAQHPSAWTHEIDLRPYCERF